MSVEEIEDAVMAVRAQLVQRRLRLDDYFDDFDKSHNGRVTINQFVRVLSSNNIQLTQAQQDTLLAAFNAATVAAARRAANMTATGAGEEPAALRARRDGTDKEINYTVFLQTVKGLEVPRELTTATQRKPTMLSQEEEERLRPLTHMLQHAVTAQSILLVPPFKDLDRLNSGKVTKTQFARCIPFKTLDPAIIELFCKKFGDGEGSVYYMPWCRLMDPTLRGDSGVEAGTMLSRGTAAEMEGDGGAEGPSSLFFSGSYRNPSLSADALVRILREQFALYKLRCEDYFTDFDKFKTGVVNSAQFESALGRLNFVKFALTEENVAALVRAYEVDPSDLGDPQPDHFPRVNYRAFLYDTNPKNFPVVGADGKESSNYFIATHSPDTFLTTPEEQAKVRELMARIRHTIESNRIYLTPVFRDFDKVRKSIHEHRTCTASRFARTLATQNLILPAEELRLLIRKYAVPHADGSPSDEINYYQFVQDVDPSQIAAFTGDSAGAGAGGSRTGTRARGVEGQLCTATNDSRLKPATTAEEVLVKVALQANTRHLRVGDFFLDFDPLRCGRVHRDKFATALSIGGVALLSGELPLLQDAYRVEGRRGCEEEIDVAAFLKDLAQYAPDQADNTASLLAGSRNARSRSTVEASPRMARMSTVAADKAAGERVTGARYTQLQLVLKRLRHDVNAHSALLTPFFSDFDRHNKGKIDKTNFLQAIARHRFVLSDEEQRLLTDFYASPQDPDSIDYRRFVRDVGQNEGQLRREGDETEASYLTTGAGANFFSANANGNGNASSPPATTTIKSDANTHPVAETDVQAVLNKIACFLQERNPRLQEFYPDGDELRHHHVTTVRFRHCISILGITDLTEPEFAVLEDAFRCEHVDGNEIDYVAFVNTLREMLRSGAGLTAVYERRKGNTNATVSLRDTVNFSPSSTAGSPSATTTTTQIRLKDKNRTLTQAEQHYLETMAAIRRTLATRRVTSLPAFREYDRTRKGWLTEGQFFAVLTSLGVKLTPAQSATVCTAYELGNGEMGYIRFCEDVDDEAFARMS